MEKKIFLPEFRSAEFMLVNLDLLQARFQSLKIAWKGDDMDEHLGCGLNPWSLQLSYFK